MNKIQAIGFSGKVVYESGPDDTDPETLNVKAESFFRGINSAGHYAEIKLNMSDLFWDSGTVINNINFSLNEFKDLELVCCTFRRCRFYDCKFINCKLITSFFDYCDLTCCKFVNCTFEEPGFALSSFYGTKFENCEVELEYKTYQLTEDHPILQIGPIGSRDDVLQAFQLVDSNGVYEILLATGCFSGSIHEFRKASEKTHSENPLIYNQYHMALNQIERHFELLRRYTK